MENGEFIRTIATKLKGARGKKKLSISGLSQLSGISRDAIWRVEDGRHAPRLMTLKSIADAMDMDVKDFL